MREIKFRAWDKEVGIMRNNFVQLDFANKHPEIVELMQYTGLKDKNGKEIYEGDIVKRESENGVVRWDDLLARFRVYMDSNKPMPRNYPCWTELLEVIGNIYENKGLLK